MEHEDHRNCLLASAVAETLWTIGCSVVATGAVPS